MVPMVRHWSARSWRKDGFHYYRHELDKFPDPVEAHARRGAPHTFNAAKFVELVTSLKHGITGTIYAPSFDHSLKGHQLETARTDFRPCGSGYFNPSFSSSCNFGGKLYPSHCPPLGSSNKVVRWEVVHFGGERRGEGTSRGEACYDRSCRELWGSTQKIRREWLD